MALRAIASRVIPSFIETQPTREIRPGSITQIGKSPFIIARNVFFGSLGEIVLTAAATDADRESPNNDVTLTMSGTHAEHFEIDPTTGVITVADPSQLDYTDVSSYNLIITATDAGDPPLASAVAVKVTIETAPTFRSATRGNFPENIAAGERVFTVTATDEDRLSLPLSISFSNSDGLFDFGGFSTIVVSTTATPADFDVETGPKTFTFELTVSDGTYNDTATLTLTVTDVNDNAPAFSPASFATAINENTQAGVTVLTVTATDADISSPNNELRYSMTGKHANHFAIDPTTGTITVVGPLEYTVAPSYTLVVTATDKGDPVLSSTAAVTITIDTTPAFSSATLLGNFPEDIAIGGTIYNMTATDEDGSALSYSFTNADGLFETDGVSAIIVKSTATSADFDVETGSKTFTFELTVSDGTYSSTATLQMTVTDVNDNTPAFSQASYTEAINEGTLADATVLTVVATDDDRDSPNNEVRYSMTGTNADHFAIDPASGAITVVGPSQLDYTDVTSYDLVVTATDKGDPVLSSTAAVTITIDTTPVLTSATQANINEDIQVGDTVFTMAATDEDGSALTFSFTNADGLFESDGAVIKVAAAASLDAFDVDTGDKTFTFDLTVTDGTYSDTATLTVTVDDVNDNTPAFSQASYATAINENSLAGATILTVAATDADRDAPNNDVTYSMTGTDHGHFVLDPNSGEITIASPSMLNYSLVTEYTLTVTATDGGDPVLSKDVTATISIESTPVLIRPAVGEDPTEINEDKAAGTLVYTFVTMDKDTQQDALTYTIDPASQFFVIDGNELKTKSDLGNTDLDVDPDGATRLFTFNVSVSDGKYADWGIVSIEVQDVNDNAPVFTEDTYTVEIGETHTGTVITVAATDDDYASPNKDVSYSITAGNDEGMFSIDESSGVITVAKELRDQLYTLTVRAEDGGSPIQSDTATVAITVNKDVVDECDTDPAICENGATCRQHVNYYYCDCADGFKGAHCETNIDDCVPEPCQNGGVCSDLVADYECDCPEGWTGKNCTVACTGHMYGRNCASPCSCNNNHIENSVEAAAQRCNIKTGVCICNPHWAGDDCNTDAKECKRAREQNTDLCPDQYFTCSDTIGSYECGCQVGYKLNPSNNDLCIPITVPEDNPLIIAESLKTATVNAGDSGHTVSLKVDHPDCTDKYNLNSKTEFAALQASIELQLEDKLGPGVVAHARNLRCGSLLYDVYLVTDNTTDAAINLSQKLKVLRDSGTITLDGTEYPVTNMTLNSNTVPDVNNVCDFYQSLQPCGSGYTCDVVDGKPNCRKIEDDNTDVILGVGIGVGVAGILVIGAMAALIVYIRRKKNTRERRGYDRKRYEPDRDYADRDRDDERYRRRRYDDSLNDDRYGNRYADRYGDRYDDRQGDRYEDPSDVSYSKHGTRVYDNRGVDPFYNPIRFSTKY